MKRQPAFLVLCSAAMLFLSGFSLLHRNKSMQQSLHVRKSTLYSVVIDKSNYQLKVFDENGWLLTYPVVFGTSEMTDKMMEGDRRTPEGHFRIIAKKIHPEWGYFLLLDYPTQTDIEKFNARKQQGLIPYNAKPGGGIGIHATRRNEDRFVDYFYNWTLGCISTKREYAKELYNMLPVGTEVTILR
ncbi:MAG: L,D-transpeptidase [Chitinophagaceae bacterium]|nr:L,D-transpeptidase [Chitinophagaceae bacterium]